MTLAAGAPYVEVLSRMFARVPPHSDASPADIKEGYWFSFLPRFAVRQVLRDFPFGIEETRNAAFHALTFVDLLGRGPGALVLHPGTQYFKRSRRATVSNLVMREWESHFTHEYGWPIYAEYRHALMPHRGKLDQCRAASGRGGVHPAVVLRRRRAATGRSADPPKLLELGPGGGPMLSAFRKRAGGGYELRLVETGRPPRRRGGGGDNLPLSKAVETDLMGNKLADAVLEQKHLKLALDPWKIRTFRLE